MGWVIAQVDAFDFTTYASEKLDRPILPITIRVSGGGRPILDNPFGRINYEYSYPTTVTLDTVKGFWKLAN